MPALIALIVQSLVVSVVPLVKMVLKALGIGMVSYVGINLVLSQATEFILNNLLGLPIEIQQILGLIKFDVAINILLSGITTKMILSGISSASGAKTKLTGV